jgi:hypothetical protein
MIDERTLTVWAISAFLAAGIGWSRYRKYRTREKYLLELAAMDGERREKTLSRLRPDLQAELRQLLMQRFGPS